jgi:5-methylcytosine-specific restriction endonuclease McrA
MIARFTGVETKPYTMREPCRWCLRDGKTVHVGHVRESNGQDVVRCAECRRQCYNAPRSETGRPQRSIKSRPDLKPGQRERILALHGSRCFHCGRTPSDGVILHIAHVLSVKEGRAQGATDEELWDDSNLYPACEECNLAMGSKSLEPILNLRLIRARLQRGRQL